MLAKAKEDTKQQADCLVEKFCESQRLIFRAYVKTEQLSFHVEGDDHVYEVIGNSQDKDAPNQTLLDYIDSLLAYFKHHLNLDACNFDEMGNSKLTNDFNKRIRTHLFQVHEDELLRPVDKNKNKANTKKLFVAVEDTVRFMRKISLKESSRMAKARKDLWLSAIESADLISHYLANLDQVHENCKLGDGASNEGVIRFAAAILDNEVIVSLKSIHGLKPRPGKESVNFSLKVGLVPVLGIDSYCVKITPVFKDQCFRLFDLQGDNEQNKKQGEVQFHFSLNNSSVDRKNSHKLAPFIQICLFDHSVTMTNKIFQGAAFLSVSSPEIRRVTTLEQFVKVDGENFIHSLNFKLLPPIVEDDQYWTELKSRSDSPAKQFVTDHRAYANKNRIPTVLE